MTKQRVLIAEDEAIIGMHLKSALTGLGYEVIGVVNNAADAVRRCGESRPDIILMDIVMPGTMDGIEAAREIMNAYDIPVVYLTGNADMATVARARETNPYGYIIKPVNAQHLFSTIDTALNRRALEMKLRDSEEKYRLVAENMVDLISWVDRDDNFTYVSPSHQRILGYDLDEMFRMKFFDVVHTDDRKMVIDAYRHFIGEKPFIRGEFRCQKADGNYVWMDSTTTYLFTADGEFDGAVFSSRDITERKSAEAAIRESEERYLSLFNRSLDCIYVHDFAGNFLDANKAALDLLGYTREEITKVSFQSLLSEDQLPVAMAMAGEIINTGLQKEKKEYRLKTNGGGIKYIETLGSMIYREGKPFAIQGIARDVTERRASDDALRKSEAQHRFITDMISDIVWTTDADFKVTYMSPSVEKATGFTVEEYMSRRIDDILTPESLARVMEQFAEEKKKEALEGADTDRVVTIECDHYRKDGTTVMMENTVKAIRDSDGRIIGLHGVSRDITERKRAIEALKETEEKFHAAFYGSPIGLSIMSLPEGRYVDVNDEFLKLSERTREEVIGYTSTELAALIMPEIRQQLFARLSETRSIRDIPIDMRTKSGKIKNVIWSGVIINSGGLKYVLAAAYDVTEHKRAAEALKQSEEKFRALFDQSSAGVFMYDRDLVVRDCNQQFADIIKAPRELVVGLNLNLLKEKGIISGIREALEGKPGFYEGPYISTLTGSTPWISATVSPLRGPGGDVVGGIGVVIDVTELKMTEEALKEQEENFLAIYDQSPVGIVIFSKYLKVTDCNKRFADMVGALRERIIGYDISLMREKAMLPLLTDAIAGKASYYEGPYHTSFSDAVLWVSTSISPIRGIDGTVKGGLLVVVDLTDRRQAEVSLRERDELFRAVFDQSPAGIVIFSRDLIVSDCNRRYAEIMHSEREKIIGFDIKNLRDKTVTPSITEALTGKTSYYEGPYMATTSDASLWVSASMSPVRDLNNEIMGVMVVVIDITSRWKAELALRESEERYRYLFDNANDFVFTLDLNGKYTSFNNQVMLKTGYSYEEGINMTISDIVAPEYKDLAWSMLKQKIEQGDSTTYEVELQAKNGGRIPLEVISQLMVKDGKPVGIQGIGRDITERRQMEEQVRRSLREKETLLREVHHRVKNNFQVILSLINLQSANIENSDIKKYFADAQSRIRSMALIHELLYQSEDISRLDISRYLSTIANELHASFHHEVPVNEPRIEAGRIELNIDQAIPCGLIINELLTNALKYAFPPDWKGTPDILVSVSEKDGMIEIIVSDNGIGIPESVDFTKTHTLGLSLTPMLAKQLSGTIDLDRSHGTRFTVRFPKK